MTKATYTGWSCPTGPAEFVDFLVENAHELDYDEFSKLVDVSTAPLDETQFEILSTDWAVSWLETTLPSGGKVYVMQHSGIEHLFSHEPLDLEKEVTLIQE